MYRLNLWLNFRPLMAWWLCPSILWLKSSAKLFPRRKLSLASNYSIRTSMNSRSLIGNLLSSSQFKVLWTLWKCAFLSEIKRMSIRSYTEVTSRSKTFFITFLTRKPPFWWRKIQNTSSFPIDSRKTRITTSVIGYKSRLAMSQRILEKQRITWQIFIRH